MGRKNLLGKIITIIIIVALLFLGYVGISSVTETMVTYYSDGSLCAKTDALSVILGDIPNAPEKTGYTFTGWYFDEGTWNKPLTRSSIIKHLADSVSPVSVHAKYFKNDGTSISSGEDNSPEVMHYLDDYNVQPLNSLSGVYLDEVNNLIYIEYNIAKVTDATLDVVSNTVVKQAEGDVTFTSQKSSKEEVTQYFSKIVSSTTGHTDSSSWNIGASVKFTLFKKIKAQIGGEISGEEMDYEETTLTTEESIQRIYSFEKSDSIEINTDFSRLENGVWYRYAVMGDCIVTQVLVYNPETGSTSSYFNTKVIPGTEHTVLTKCSSEERFQYPGIDLSKDSIELSQVMGGLGTATSPYQISHPVHFMLISVDPSAHYKLMSDLDFTGYSLPTKVIFSGVLDGNNKVICGSNEYVALVDDPETTGRIIIFDQTPYDVPHYYGLFAKNYGEIKDLTLSKFRILGEDECHDGAWVYVGCVTGQNHGIISNVDLDECWIECFRTYSNIGLVTGENSGIIENCDVNKGYVYGNGNAGGITGLNHNVIDSCSVTGRGSNTNHENRFLYVNKRTSITSSWGGIVGEATSSSEITDVHLEDALIVTRFKVYAKNCCVGFIAGKNAGTISGISVSDTKFMFHKKSETPFGPIVKYFFQDDGNVGHNTGTVTP